MGSQSAARDTTASSEALNDQLATLPRSPLHPRKRKRTHLSPEPTGERSHPQPVKTSLHDRPPSKAKRRARSAGLGLRIPVFEDACPESRDSSISILTGGSVVYGHSSHSTETRKRKRPPDSPTTSALRFPEQVTGRSNLSVHSELSHNSNDHKPETRSPDRNTLIISENPSIQIDPDPPRASNHIILSLSQSQEDDDATAVGKDQGPVNEALTPSTRTSLSTAKPQSPTDTSFAAPLITFTPQPQICSAELLVQPELPVRLASHPEDHSVSPLISLLPPTDFKPSRYFEESREPWSLMGFVRWYLEQVGWACLDRQTIEDHWRRGLESFKQQDSKYSTTRALLSSLEFDRISLILERFWNNLESRQREDEARRTQRVQRLLREIEMERSLRHAIVQGTRRDSLMRDRIAAWVGLSPASTMGGLSLPPGWHVPSWIRRSGPLATELSHPR
ncbi:hypothetical protein M427DRAFT_51804 [Gonapodya prolifera JEL478]|uniref:Uncharacterized protein n=1 Tax=Gonapodya prolifera (strain JEL478) TaxID=1344416 RepID=A0A139AVU4_GONPJ|nr:hypothetical protein M427DRAFT_51804 [Gonapodya prolifera JEL478]|eukprot:KXS20850.1 hypothetical protein M427DRAFT_51804 [Gonapodya prolifera JEL478]